MQMAHEKLDVYRLGVEVARWVSGVRFPRGMSDLKNQGVRAASSVVLNTAEGLRRRNQARTHHFEIARGSAAETLAVLHITTLPGWEEQADKLRRIDRMLEKMGG